MCIRNLPAVSQFGKRMGNIQKLRNAAVVGVPDVVKRVDESCRYVGKGQYFPSISVAEGTFYLDRACEMLRA